MFNTILASRRAYAALGLLLMLAACGGSNGSGNAGDNSATPQPSLVLVASATDIMPGTAPVTLSATSPAAAAAVAWTLAEGSPGTLDATSGNSVHYLPPAPDALDADTQVSITATSGGISKTLSLLVHRAPAGLYLKAGDIGGRGSADGDAVNARFNMPKGIAVAADGTLFVADYWNNTIRKISPQGAVSTVAGRPGEYGNVDAAASEARFTGPSALAVAPDGTLYVVDHGNGIVRKITPDSRVTTFASQSMLNGWPLAVALDRADNLYVLERNGIDRITPAGVVTALVGGPRTDDKGYYKDNYVRLENAVSMTMGKDDTLYVLDACVIRKVTLAGTVTTLAGKQLGACARQDGPPTEAMFNAKTSGIAIDAQDVLYVFDEGYVRKVTPDGFVSTIVQPPPATFGPWQVGMAAGADGNLYLANSEWHVIQRLSPAGELSLVAGAPGSRGLSVDGKGAAARFDAPTAIATDAAGNTYVADGMPYRFNLRRIAPDGTVSTVYRYDSPGVVTGIATDGDGNIHLAIQPHTYSGGSAVYYSGPTAVLTLAPSGAATWTPLPVGHPGFDPLAIAADADGNLYVSAINAVRKISRTGAITVVPGTESGSYAIVDGQNGTRLVQPLGMTADATGNLYIADGVGATVKRLSPDGTLTTIAGKSDDGGYVDGPAMQARFARLTGITRDERGNLYMSDYGNNAIRKLTPDGMVSTVAGGTRAAGIVLGQPGQLDGPLGVSYVAPNKLQVLTANSVLTLLLP